MPGSDAVERSFPQYSDDSESEDDADEEEDSYFHQSIRKIDQSRQNQSPNSAGSTPPTRLNQGSGAGRSGLVMNVGTLYYISYTFWSGDRDLLLTGPYSILYDHLVAVY